MYYRIALSLSLMCVGAVAYSQQQRTMEPLCASVASAPIPKADLPLHKMPETCDDIDLYYSGNYRQARYCAYSARDTTEEGSMDAPTIPSPMPILTRRIKRQYPPQKIVRTNSV